MGNAAGRARSSGGDYAVRSRKKSRLVPVLRIAGILVIAALVVGQAAGLRPDRHTMLKALDYFSRMPKAAWALFAGPGAPAPAGSGAVSVARANGIGSYEVKEDPAALNVKAFGAKGDGVTDDTAAIQRAVNAVPAAGGKVYVPPGVYMVEALESVKLKSRVTLLMAKGAVLRAIPNGSEHYNILAIENVSDVTVVGGVIQGERKRHIGDTGQWGCGVLIGGSKNVTILGTAVIDCWGDGFYIGNETAKTYFSGEFVAVPENIRLIDVQADNNRRQGISIIAGRNVEIIRPVLTNINGVAPSAGVDIEPNYNRDFLENIVVTDAVTKGNAGPGILINLSGLGGTTRTVNIRIVNHRDEGSERGMYFIDANTRDNVTAGTVLVESPEWVNAKKNGVTIANHDYRAYDLIIRNPRIINANSSGLRADAWNGSAIAIFHDIGRTPARTGVIGNVTIYNPEITSSGARLVTPVFVWDDVPGRSVQKVAIVDPVLNGVAGNMAAFDEVKQYIRFTAR